MVAFINRWALVAAGVVGSLVLGVTPAVALTNAPVADSAEAEAITKVHTTSATGDKKVCTGTAVSPTQILTAQHCVDNARDVTVAGYEGGRVPVISTSNAFNDGHDVIFLNLGESWTGATLPMNPARPNIGDELEYYGMGEGDTLHTTTGRVSGYADIRYGRVSESYIGSLTLSRLQSGARAEHGDSGGPIIKDGEIVGVIRSSISGSPRVVIGTPLSTVPEFVGASKLSKPVIQASEPAQLEDTLAVADTQEAVQTESAALPTDIALAALVAVLLALGIHSGALELPQMMN